MTIIRRHDAVKETPSVRESKAIAEPGPIPVRCTPRFELREAIGEHVVTEDGEYDSAYYLILVIADDSHSYEIAWAKRPASGPVKLSDKKEYVFSVVPRMVRGHPAIMLLRIKDGKKDVFVNRGELPAVPRSWR